VACGQPDTQTVVVYRDDTDVQVVYVPVDPPAGATSVVEVSYQHPPVDSGTSPGPAQWVEVGHVVLENTSEAPIPVTTLGVEFYERPGDRMRFEGASRLSDALTRCRLVDTDKQRELALADTDTSHAWFRDLSDVVLEPLAVRDLTVSCRTTDAVSGLVRYVAMEAPDEGSELVFGVENVKALSRDLNGGIWSGFAVQAPFKDPNCQPFWFGGTAVLFPAQFQTDSYPLFTPRENVTHVAPGAYTAGNFIVANAGGCGKGFVLEDLRLTPHLWDEDATPIDTSKSVWTVASKANAQVRSVSFPASGPFEVTGLNTPVGPRDIQEIAITVDMCDRATFGAACDGVSFTQGGHPWVLDVELHWRDVGTGTGFSYQTGFPTYDPRKVRLEISMD
jgi:hypothetical protein